MTWELPPPPPPPVVAAPPRSYRGRVAMIVVLAVGVLVVSSIVAAQRIRDHGHSYPSGWDARVADLVAFDEKHRGLTYDHPVAIDFLTPEEYSARTRTPASDVTDEDRSGLQVQGEEMRALGLAGGELDLFGAVNDLNDSGTLAFYDPESERITVRGTEMTPGLRLTLVHELVHVLQDQHFDISADRTDGFDTSQESSSFDMIVEGDAVRIENEYLDSLSDDDSAQALDESTLAPDDTSLDSVPVALQAFSQLPYILGPEVVGALAADGGNERVDEALRHPPTTDREMLDVRELFDGFTPSAVDEPALPDGVTDSTDSGDFGAIAWYVVLADRIDPVKALEAVDGWAGDAYVAYTKDGATCLDLALVGDDSTATETLHDALDGWAASLPPSQVSVGMDGDEVRVHACDPGSSGMTYGRALDAIQVPAIRASGAREAMQYGGLSSHDAAGFGDCLISTIPFDDIVAADSPDAPPDELTARIEAAYSTCLDKSGG